MEYDLLYTQFSNRPYIKSHHIIGENHTPPKFSSIDTCPFHCFRRICQNIASVTESDLNMTI